MKNIIIAISLLATAALALDIPTDAVVTQRVTSVRVTNAQISPIANQ